MRLALIVLLSAVIQQTPETGTIEGTVNRTGSPIVPIAGAQVKATAPSPLRDGSLLILETTTDGAGHFIFSEVPSGTFKVEVGLEGYGFRASKFIFQPTQAVQVTVAPGKRVQVPNLSLTPSATIRGRVIDAEGLGVANLPVEFLRLTVNQDGKKTWALTGMVETETNDKGEYQHEMLGPGDYYVRTILDAQSDLPIAVYYPETTNGGAAAPVVLGEGSQLVADIRVGRARNAPTYKVSGKVANPFLNATPVSTDLILMKSDSSEPIGARDMQLSALSLADRDTGRFEFPAVRAGSYDLWAGAEIDGKRFLAKVPIEVRDQDIENVSLALRAGVDITGRLVVDGAAKDVQFFRRVSRVGDPLINAGSLEIALNRQDRFPFGTAPAPVIDDNGVSFTFRGVPEGPYTIRGTVRSALGAYIQNSDFYIADIRASGRSVFDTGFQVGSDPVDSIEILVETSGGAIEGTLQGKSELPAFLVFAPNSLRQGNASLFRWAVFPANGKFQLKGIAPGNYRLFSVPYLNEIPPFRDPEFLARHESRALNITIQKGTTTSGLQVPYLNLGR
jgi:hypothetical protein